MHGVRAAAPEKETRSALEKEPLYEAERLRIIYQLITNSKADGGAGITPKNGEWKNVESIFALHDHEANKKWIKKWSTSYFLKVEDLDDIRNRLGEKVKLSFGGIDGHTTNTFPRLPTTSPSPNPTSPSSSSPPSPGRLHGFSSATSPQFTRS